MTPNVQLREEYERTGLISQCFALDNISPLPGLLADAHHFERSIVQTRADGRHAVIYDVTEAIETVARDPALLHVVCGILGTDDWVMWGANVRAGTPNEAGAWHVDLESFFWPSVTVVVGVSGCTGANATRVLAGTQDVELPPSSSLDLTDDAAVFDAARERGLDISVPSMPQGFNDGKFMLFNAKAWHSGQRKQSNHRVALFMHYQRADALRVPQMKDYRYQSFHRHAAAYIAGSPEGKVNRGVAPGPHSGRLSRLLLRLGI